MAEHGFEDGQRWRLGPKPSLGGLTAPEQEFLGRHWRGLAEHGLRAARWYGELGLRLMGLQAGPEWLMQLHTVAGTKIDLVRRALTLAAVYSGEEKDPVPGSQGDETIAVQPEKLAVEVFWRGIVWEHHRLRAITRGKGTAKEPAVVAFLESEAEVAQGASELLWSALDTLAHHAHVPVLSSLEELAAGFGEEAESKGMKAFRDGAKTWGLWSRIWADGLQQGPVDKLAEHGFWGTSDQNLQSLRGVLARDLRSWCRQRRVIPD